jgi:hypothetical protein
MANLNNTTIPELEEYYTENRTDRNGKAWLLAGGSLIATLAVIGGIFLGGRWLYNTIANKKDDASTASTTEVAVAPTTAVTIAPEVSTVNPATTTVPTPTAVVPTIKSTPTLAPSVTPTPSKSTTTKVAGNTTALPNTGVSSQLLTLLAVVFVASYTAYTRKLSRR